MRHKTFLWVLAFVVTAASAWFQRTTGPTYPLQGKGSVGGKTISYSFDRSHGGTDDAPVRVTAVDSSVQGTMFWRRFKTDDAWTAVVMKREGDHLTARLPHQPPAGKIQYFVRVTSPEDHRVLPKDEPGVIRFKGDVPLPVLIIHVIAMFGGMLLSTRTGFESLLKNPRPAALTYWTIGFLAFGGMILGPIVQKYAFGAYWTGWPFGMDLTDNKTLIAFAGWIAAAVALHRSAKPKMWILAAAVLTLAVFMIPHSVLGSELDYKKLDAQPPISRLDAHPVVLPESARTHSARGGA